MLYAGLAVCLCKPGFARPARPIPYLSLAFVLRWGGLSYFHLLLQQLGRFYPIAGAHLATWVPALQWIFLCEVICIASELWSLMVARLLLELLWFLGSSSIDSGRLWCVGYTVVGRALSGDVGADAAAALASFFRVCTWGQIVIVKHACGLRV